MSLKSSKFISIKPNMDFNYNKNDNKNLFRGLEKMNLYNVQNYVPMYELFFTMDSINNNTINIDLPEKLLSIDKYISSNTAEGFVSTITNTKKKKPIFIKYAPLIDPIRYMVGKYKDVELTLPTFSNNKNKDCSYTEKIHDPYNSSYVDGFFSYISSTLHNKGFINAVGFHGIFIGYQKNLKVNIIEDLEFLADSSYFHNNINNLFQIENDDIFSLNSDRSGMKIKKLKILDTLKTSRLIIDDVDHMDSKFGDNDVDKYIDELQELTEFNTIEGEEYNLNNICDDCSSGSSLTDNDSDDNMDDMDDVGDSGGSGDIGSFSNKHKYDGEDGMNNNGEDGNEDADGDDSSEISYIESVINNFPVTIICMEKCENTLDYLMENTEITTNEWVSCLMQVIVSLIVFQKKFNFTHNDLHTSNIMFVETKRKYIYYKIEGIIYKVPTYGKIFKIIDFGRAIYSFKDVLIYSDAFKKKEDAATQYNFGPIYDDSKPIVLPNPSFDLCRLACSLYDHFKDEFEVNNNRDSVLKKLIESWCKDDKDKNILYKSSGEERYPDFKLYKMIARTVHNSKPIDQLQNSLFKTYITIDVPDNVIESVIDIDNL
tara:strand:+ start:310 stop:2106 length:1797 start_codon:yes stop_codon:yes gene_type:complete